MNRPKSPNVTLLRRALTANAVFSTLCALIFLAASAPVAGLVGTPQADILSTGISLVVFFGLILLVLTRPDVTRRWVLGLAVAIAAMDVLWVLTTPLKVASFTATGQAIFAAIALVVAVFAVLQIRALYGIFVELRQRGPSTVALQNHR